MKFQSTSEELPLSSPSLFEGIWPGFSFLWILAAWNCRWSILKLLWADYPLMCKRFWGMLTPHFCSPFFSPQESNWLVPISAYLVKSSGFGTVSQIHQQALFLPGTTHWSFTKGDVKPEEGLSCLACACAVSCWGTNTKVLWAIRPMGYKVMCNSARSLWGSLAI